MLVSPRLMHTTYLSFSSRLAIALTAVLSGSAELAQAEPAQAEPAQSRPTQAESAPPEILLYAKGGYSYAVARQSSANGSFEFTDPERNGWAVDVGAVFTTPLSRQLRPYVDFAALVRSDRRMLIPGIGLRYDFLDPAEKFLPFITFGMGYNLARWTTSPTTLSAENEQGQSIAATVQAGFDYYLSEHFALDLTLRSDFYHLTTTAVQGGSIRQLSDKASLSALGGITFRLGKSAQEPQDTDGDGVFD
ncbi:MAG: DUF3575 domain-containing protein, partial [Polyangiaceae bacterium]|nr:DUF3575 domain-containing protein [Polyangiaceae bacterium]